MFTIAFLVPSETLIPFIEDITSEHATDWNKDHESRFACSIHVAKNYRSIPRQAFDADVFVARGLITAELRKIHSNVNLVQVPIGGEMVATVLRAVKEHGRQPIAVIGSQNLIYSATGLGESLDLDIKLYPQGSNEDFAIKADVNRILQEGARILICGPVTYQHAASRDCYPYILGMSRESVWDALTRAKEIAVVRWLDREKSAQLQAVLDAAREGVIVTDTAGRITICNASAAGILDESPARVLGEGIWNVLPQIEDMPGSSTNQTVDIKGRKISIRKNRVLIGRAIHGLVITLMPVQE